MLNTLEEKSPIKNTDRQTDGAGARLRTCNYEPKAKKKKQNRQRENVRTEEVFACASVEVLDQVHEVLFINGWL